MKTKAELEQRGRLWLERYDPKKGYPGDDNLYYECPHCETFMPSHPANYDEAQCQCRYLLIHIDWGRFSIGRAGQTIIEPRLFRLVPQQKKEAESVSSER